MPVYKELSADEWELRMKQLMRRMESIQDEASQCEREIREMLLQWTVKNKRPPEEDIVHRTQRMPVHSGCGWRHWEDQPCPRLQSPHKNQ